MRFKTFKLREFISTYWQPATLYWLLTIGFAAILIFKLGSLTGGYSGTEAAMSQNLGWSAIAQDPLNAPHSLLAYGIAYLFSVSPFQEHNELSLRLASTIFGLAIITAFYWIVRYWHGQRSALLGTIILGSSAWFLHTARQGTPEILLMLPLVLIACVLWFRHSANRLALILGLITAACLIYVPGMLWLLIAGLVWQWKTVLDYTRQYPVSALIGGLTTIVMISPLILAIYKSPTLLKSLAGLPLDSWPGLIDSLNRLSDIGLNLVVQGPANAAQWLGQIPLLDAFSLAALVLGAYLYIKRSRLLRSQFIGVILLISITLISLGGLVTQQILIPFIYILIAAGIGLLLDRWFKVFPRNTIAQGLGIGLVTLAIVSVCSYGLSHYFVAWPNNPDTKKVFIIQRAVPSDKM